MILSSLVINSHDFDFDESKRLINYESLPFLTNVRLCLHLTIQLLIIDMYKKKIFKNAINNH